MDNMNEIIAKLRRDAGLTQEQLAGIIGVSPQAVSKWETGTTMPDILLLPVIADIFDKDIDYLFGRLREKAEAVIRKENVHEEVYNLFFEMLQKRETLGVPAVKQVYRPNKNTAESDQTALSAVSS